MRRRVTDPKTWATFEKALSTYQLGHLDGIGLALTDKNGIVGFDLDDCRDPETGEIGAVGTSSSLNNSSPIGRFLRAGPAYEASATVASLAVAVVRATLRCTPSGRYLCITGHHLDGTQTTIEPVQAGIDAVYAQIFPPQATAGIEPLV